MNNLLRKMLNRVYMNQADELNAGGGDGLNDFAAEFARVHGDSVVDDKSGGADNATKDDKQGGDDGKDDGAGNATKDDKQGGDDGKDDKDGGKDDGKGDAKDDAKDDKTPGLPSIKDLLAKLRPADDAEGDDKGDGKDDKGDDKDDKASRDDAKGDDKENKDGGKDGGKGDTVADDEAITPMQYLTQDDVALLTRIRNDEPDMYNAILAVSRSVSLAARATAERDLRKEFGGQIKTLQEEIGKYQANAAEQVSRAKHADYYDNENEIKAFIGTQPAFIRNSLLQGLQSKDAGTRMEAIESALALVRKSAPSAVVDERGQKKSGSGKGSKDALRQPDVKSGVTDSGKDGADTDLEAGFALFQTANQRKR